MMECVDIRRYLDEYIDQECGAEISAAVEAHLRDCPQCAAEYDERRSLYQAMRSLPPQQLPLDFETAFKQRLQEEQQKRPRQKPLLKRTWVRALGLCACLLLVIGVAGRLTGGMGAASAPTASYDMAAEEAAPASEEGYSGGANPAGYKLSADYDAAPMEAPAPEPEAVESESMPQSVAGDSRGAAAEQEISRKIIMNWFLHLQVEDFDAAFNEIERIAAAYNGYVVSGSAYNNTNSTYRDGFISIRVEASRADAAVAEISGLGLVENSDFSSQDVTSDYYDISARLQAYLAQEARLLELYERAETIEDLLAIEGQLAAARAQIEALQGRINYYDQLTALSLIEVNLYTPSVYTQNVEPKGWAGFTEQLGKRFLRGLNNTLDFLADVLFWLARSLPALILIGVVVLGAVLIIRRRRRRTP